MRLVMLGPPGSGKGTQAVVLAKKLDIPHISTGEIFREAMKNQTPLGIKVKAVMDAGDLVSDDIVVEIVKERLEREDCRTKGFLFDGFPRTLAQGEALDQCLQSMKMPLDHVVELRVEQDLLIKRLSGRRACAVCKKDFNIFFKPPRVEGRCDECGGALTARSDDNMESILHRLEVDAEQTRPLHRFYKGKNLLVSVEGTGGVEKITEAILARLGDAKK